MKKVSFLTLLLAFVFAPIGSKAQLEEEYYGLYVSEDGMSYFGISVYDEENYGFMELTEQEKAQAQFVFSFQEATGEEGTFIGVLKDRKYVSGKREGIPAFTFGFSLEEGNRYLTVTNSTGGSSKFIQETEVEPIYYDEEYTDGEPYEDEEGMEDVEVDIRSYSRSDGAELAVIFQEEDMNIFALHIPASKTCSEVMLEGMMTATSTSGQYTFTEEETGYVWNIYQTSNGWSFQCFEGDCYDKKGKCGVWKEAFVQGD